MGMIYEINYVCFPCRRNARKGRRTRRRSGWSIPPVPTCPSCGNQMMGWNQKVPGSDKEWVAEEKRCIAAYEEDMAFNEQHNFMIPVERRWDDARCSGMIGHKCAPLYFQGLA
jgi:hypothetical protein